MTQTPNSAEQPQHPHCIPGDCTGCCGCSITCTSHPCGEREPFQASGRLYTAPPDWRSHLGPQTDHGRPLTPPAAGDPLLEVGGLPEPQMHPSMGDAVGYAMGHNARMAADGYPETAPEPYTGGMATCMTREPHAPHTGTVVLELAGTEYGTKYRCEGVTGPVPQPLTETPLLTDLAALILRLDMALVDAGRGMDDVRPGDGELTAWALERAGHLFDHHVLNDYGLVSDEDHFPRCVAYRHLDRTLKDMIPNG